MDDRPNASPQRRSHRPLAAFAAAFLFLTASGVGLPLRSVGAAGVETEVESADLQFSRARTLIAQHCVDCHSDGGTGDLDLEQFSSVEQLVTNRPLWEQIRQRIADHQMPPREADPLAASDREFLTGWIAGTLHRSAAAAGPQPGPFRLRRLNRSQYANTLRDLLNINFDAAADLPEDGAGGEGFDNAAETLFLSPLHAEKYIDAGRAALRYASQNQASRELVIEVWPDDQTSDAEAAERVLDNFCARAYRRPGKPSEIRRLLTIYDEARLHNLSYDTALYEAMLAAICSPNFLMLVESPALPGEPRPLDSFELACRLSYFLYNSMPDEPLREAAANGRLTTEAGLDAEVRRMIEDRRLQGFAESFMGQWLGTKDVGSRKRPAAEVYPAMNDEVADALQIEPVRMFEHMLRERRPLLDFLDADYIFMNEDTAPIYRVATPGRYLNENTQRYDLPPDSVRGGVLTMAGPLLVSSHASRTSPVLRGKWVLETLLGHVPPPPPPGIPPLPEPAEGQTKLTVRQRLEAHREHTQCASCHDAIDPLGFGLECFDAAGQYRTHDGGEPLDLAGTLPDGRSFEGPEELKRLLLQQKDAFVRHFVRRLYAYSLGRGLVDSDFPEIDRIAAATIDADYRSDVAVLEVVKSMPFRSAAVTNQSDPPRYQFTSLNR